MPIVFDLKRSESACNTCANVNVDLYSACGGQVVIEVVHAIAYCTNATRGLSAIAPLKLRPYGAIEIRLLLLLLLLLLAEFLVFISDGIL